MRAQHDRGHQFGGDGEFGLSRHGVSRSSAAVTEVKEMEAFVEYRDLSA